MAAKSTHELVASTQIKTGSGVVCALTVVTDGADDAIVMLYDTATAAGLAVTNKITEITVKSTSNYGGRTWMEPVLFTEGLYAALSGSGAGSFFVEWRN
jgi:hypothetical protein